MKSLINLPFPLPFPPSRQPYLPFNHFVPGRIDHWISVTLLRRKIQIQIPYLTLPYEVVSKCLNLD